MHVLPESVEIDADMMVHLARRRCEQWVLDNQFALHAQDSLLGGVSVSSGFEGYVDWNVQVSHLGVRRCLDVDTIHEEDR